MSDQDARNDAWVMNADGSGRRRLTSLGVTGHFMRWSSDGRFVILRAGPKSYRVPIVGGPPEELPEVVGGAHMSFSPDQGLIMDVKAHKTLWVSPLRGGTPYQVFEFPDLDARIDYPVWSPEGRWVLFDRAVAKGGDIWMLEGIE
jgi:Tol biopolymer transport system component